MLFVMHRNEQLNWAVGFSNQMDSGETLDTLAVTVWDGTTEVSGGAGFTSTAVLLSTVRITGMNDGVSHPIGQAVTFTILGDDTLSNKKYTLRVEADNADTSEKLIAQDIDGNPPLIIVGVWAEAP